MWQFCEIHAFPRSKVYKIYPTAFAPSFVDLIASPRNVSILPSYQSTFPRKRKSKYCHGDNINQESGFQYSEIFYSRIHLARSGREVVNIWDIFAASSTFSNDILTGYIFPSASENSISLTLTVTLTADSLLSPLYLYLHHDVRLVICLRAARNLLERHSNYISIRPKLPTSWPCGT